MSTQKIKKPVRGKLKIFFGCFSGVGKTYAMLSAGFQRLQEGADVVASIAETNKHPETVKFTQNLPVLPFMEITDRGIRYREFDLDAALARKPDIILLDEIAHTNAPGTRHPKRWNDVEELLDAGISVYTTLNVQNLESLNDLVTGTTGIMIKETIPDLVFDSADDVVLVDINADELLRRISEGKVYTGTEAQQEFRKSNIIALRELALRRTTERVDAQMDAFKIREGLGHIPPVTDKVLVCIGHSHLSEKLIRTAKRMATSLKAPWTAVYIENARHYRLSDADKKAVEAHMRMAERLGGKTAILQGTNAVDEIMAYANDRGVTKIVIGKPYRPRFKELVVGSLADKIIRNSGSIDVYVVTSDETESSTVKPQSDLVEFKPRLYLQGILTAVACTILGIVFDAFIKPVDEVLIYMIGVIIVSARFGRGPAVLYALISAACFNFFFTQPYYTLKYDRSYLMTVGAMLVTSFVIGSYASKLRLQALFARKREHETQTFYAFTREMAKTRGRLNMAEVAARHIEGAVEADIVLCLPDDEGKATPLWGTLPKGDVIKEAGLVQWCFHNTKPAGIGTDTMPSAGALYLPLNTGNGTIGVLGIIPKGNNKTFSPDKISQIENFAHLFASGLERANASEAAQKLSADSTDAA